MRTIVQAPCGTRVVRRRTGPGHRSTRPNATARAVLHEVRRRPGYTGVHYAEIGLGNPARSPVVVHPHRPANTSGPVLVALDDDDNPAVLTAYGLAEARRRGVPLRTVYIWTDCRPPDCDHHPHVAVTVPVRRGGVLALLFPIPPATVSFRASARAYPAGSPDHPLPERLSALLPAQRRDAGTIIEIRPVGHFVTYGVGVSLRQMRNPAMARDRVPVE